MDRRRTARLLLLLPGGAALLGGLWSGLVRLGVIGSGADLAPVHGPLMVSGFLGTVISLERAVAIDRPWAFAVPATAALGALSLLFGLPWTYAALAGVVAAAGLAGLFGVLLARDPAVHTVVMAVGALAWLGGALAWLAGQPFATSAWWWAGFLVLTIVGERIELNRVRQLGPGGRRVLLSLVGLLVVALVVAHLAPPFGVRLIGAALVGCAAWLLRYDVARRTVRGEGLTRFVAVCLLAGYAWLGVAGALAIAYGAQWAGPAYDAQLHAVFVGFVLSMIFGHAPVVLPAVLMLRLSYRPIAYLPLLVLHVALVVRVIGDLAGAPAPRALGGIGTVAGVLLFVAFSGFSALAPAPRGGRTGGSRGVARSEGVAEVAAFLKPRQENRT